MTHWRTWIKDRRLHWLRKYKVEQGCANCGFNAHPLALDFAHIDQNEKSIHIWKTKSRGSGPSNLYSRITKYGTELHRQRWKELKDEIRKCRVLCKNCHVVETYENNEVANSSLMSKKRKEIREKYELDIGDTL